MEKSIPLKKLLPYILAALIILPILITILFQNFKIVTILKEKPFETVVANISSTSAQIYTKTVDPNIYRLYYKKTSDTGLFRNADDMKIYRDNLSNKKLYVLTLENLEPGSEYQFKIESQNNTWEEGFLFTTKNIANEIALPNIETGNSTEQSFVLLTNSNNEKIMLDTQYHGTWAFDNKNEAYTSTEYANYTSKNDLQVKLNNLIAKPVYAESGANCKMGINVSNFPLAPSKAKVVDIIGRWVGSCPKGGYGNECYEDVYCKAMAAGVKPGFVFAIWSNESGGSNYAYSPNVEDFGIHASTFPKRDFTAQIERFLSVQAAGGGSSYISACNKSAGYNELSQWGARFWQGDCQTPQGLEKGLEYITQIGTIYSWYTNSTLTFPFSASGGANCSYSSAYTNTAYNSCTAQGTPTNPTNPTDPTNPTEPIPPGGDGVKKWLPVTGTMGGKKISPEVDRYCTDPDGCICIWKYNIKPGETTKNASNGYTCTPDMKVIKTVKSCCQTKDGLSFIWPYECKGEILKDIPESSCKATESEIKFTKGINFLEALTILNKEESPIDTAKGLIQHTNNRVIAVGLLRNDVWGKILKVEKGEIKGEDFNLEPGETYLVIAKEDVVIPIQGFKSETTLDMKTLKGWNLVPVSLLKSASNSTKSILQNTTYTYINQIAQWQEKQSLFKYTLRDKSNQIYGDDLRISDSKGIFVRIPQ